MLVAIPHLLLVDTASGLHTLRREDKPVPWRAWGPSRFRLALAELADRPRLVVSLSFDEVPIGSPMSPTEATHKVQRNVAPSHYEKYWADTVQIVVATADIGGATDSPRWQHRSNNRRGDDLLPDRKGGSQHPAALVFLLNPAPSTTSRSVIGQVLTQTLARCGWSRFGCPDVGPVSSHHSRFNRLSS